MNTISVICLCIISSQCAVIKDDLNKNGSPGNANRQFQEQLMREIDSFDYNNLKLYNDIIIDEQKDKETQTINTETETSNINLSPRIQEWEVRILLTGQPIEEINHMLSIIEATANKTRQLIKKCFSDEFAVTCYFKTIFGVTNHPLSKIQKRETKQNNTLTTDSEEVNRLLKLVEDATSGVSDGKNCTITEGVTICNVYVPEVTNQPLSKIQKRETKQNNALTTDSEEVNRLLKLVEDATNGVSDGKNCTITEGVTICNVYVPEDSAKSIHKREIEFQNNILPLDEDVTEINDFVNIAGGRNCTVITAENADICSSLDYDSSSTFIDIDECLPGKGRADDGTCVPEVD